MIATDLWWWNATSIGHTASKKVVTNCACWWWKWGGFNTRVQHPTATFMKFNWIASHTVGKLWEVVDLDKTKIELSNLDVFSDVYIKLMTSNNELWIYESIRIQIFLKKNVYFKTRSKMFLDWIHALSLAG